MKTIQSVIRSMVRTPLKSVLTLLTVGIGVGVLVFALSISDTFDSMLKEQLQAGGIVINVANAELNDSGEINEVRPPEFDENAIEAIRAEVPGVVAISPVSRPFWSEIVANGTSYQVRSIVGTNEEYLEVMGLELLAGTFYFVEDVTAGAKKTVITESLARVLFGSAEDALGQTLRPPASDSPESNQQSNARDAIFSFAPTFTVIGVVEDPPDIQRTAYQVADMMVPFTALVPQGSNASQFLRFMMGSMVAQINSVAIETAEAQIRDVLTIKQAGFRLNPRGIA